MDDGDLEADLEEAWSRVLAAWDDPESHRRFLVLCDVTGRLAAAGRRYRAVRDADPARRAEAERRIDEVLRMALARLEAAEKTPPSKARSRIEWVALGIGAALIAAVLYQVLRAS